MVQEHDKIAVGVSGGADSVCLLFLMEKLSRIMTLDLCAVHVNHMIRGDEAVRDEEFVKQFCGSLGVRCICIHADVPEIARAKKIGLEEAGRMARYKAFEDVLTESGGSAGEGSCKAAVAHHRDDNVETFLLNLVRGSGIKGLSGMKPVSRRGGLTIIRPLLFMGRSEIEGYLKANSLTFIQDSTNFSDDYARNRIRNTVIPELTKINSAAAEHINAAALTMDTFSDYYGKSVEEAFKKAVSLHDGEASVDINKLIGFEPLIQSGIAYKALGAVSGTLKDIGRVHAGQILSLADKQTGKAVSLPYGMEAERSYSRIIIRKACKEAAGGEHGAEIRIRIGDIPEGESVSFSLPGGAAVSISVSDVNDGNRESFKAKNKYTKAFDCDMIKGTLVLGKPKSSDKITFAGGTKTIKKYFTDEKIPAAVRQGIPVLKDDEGILWIIGCRIGEKYKITGKTRKALVVSVSGGGYGRED